jgi:hypothetical protein
MKTYLTILILGALSIVACKNNEKSESSNGNEQKQEPVVNQPATTHTVDTFVKQTASLDTNCIAGTYILNIQTAVINSPIKIILNPDGTGQDNYSGSKLPITWTLKNGKFHLRSSKDPKGSPGTEAVINCKTGELTVFGKTFGKYAIR